VGGGIGQGVVAVVDCLVGRGACMVAVLVDRHSSACGGESIACVCAHTWPDFRGRLCVAGAGIPLHYGAEVGRS
jgi:hypothetical protein